MAGDGEVTLIVGPDKVKMIANKQALELSSDVFQKMFQMSFKEGQTRRVELPEDDVEAFKHILDTTHFRSTEPEVPAANVCHAIAILVDKYNFKSMRPSLKWWYLQNVPRSLENLMWWLGIAYILKDSDQFLQLSKMIVMHNTESIDPNAYDAIMFPEVIPLKLALQRQIHRTALAEVMLRISMKTSCNCDHGRTNSGKVIERLLNDRLLPVAHAGGSLGTLCAGLSKLVTVGDVTPHSTGCLKYHDSLYSSQSRSMGWRKDVLDVVASVERGQGIAMDEVT